MVEWYCQAQPKVQTKASALSTNILKYHILLLSILRGHKSARFGCFVIKIQAKPKVQTKASAFGGDGYNIIIIQPPTHPDKYEGDEIEQNLEKKFVCLYE